MPRRTPAKHPSAAVPPPAPQLELFPEPVHIEALAPQQVGGTRTRVRGVWLVRLGADPAPHRVFHDRHGWYCEVHGPSCRAVASAQLLGGEGAAPALVRGTAVAGVRIGAA